MSVSVPSSPYGLLSPYKSYEKKRGAKLPKNNSSRLFLVAVIFMHRKNDQSRSSMSSSVQFLSKLEVISPARFKRESAYTDTHDIPPFHVDNATYRVRSPAFLHMSQEDLERLERNWLHLKYTGSADLSSHNPYAVRATYMTCSAVANIGDWSWRINSNTVEGFAILTYDEYAEHIRYRFGMEIEVRMIVDLGATPHRTEVNQMNWTFPTESS